VTSGRSKRTCVLSGASLGIANLTFLYYPGGAEGNHGKVMLVDVLADNSHPGGICLEELRKTTKYVRVVDVSAENSRILAFIWRS
jgi:hypothetical protein